MSLTMAIGLLALWSSPTRAQDRRLELIDRARGEFDPAVALDLLMDASDPNQGLDSIWAVGVHNLASTLVSTSNSASAAVFLRWAVRHGRQWPMDRVNFPAAVVDLYDASAVSVDDVAGNPRVRTSWEWPAGLVTGEAGAIEVMSSDPAVVLSASVEGQSPTAGQGSFRLAPGSYAVVVSAPGFETARVVREVLPGATTRLEVGLRPLEAAGEGAPRRSAFAKSPMAAAVIEFLVPTAGYLYAGKWSRGLLPLGVSAAGIAVIRANVDPEATEVCSACWVGLAMLFGGRIWGVVGSARTASAFNREMENQVGFSVLPTRGGVGVVVSWHSR